MVGVLGTFNSGCAKLIIPILNRAPNGPVGMVSAANTAVELTHTASWTAPGEPGVYYPTGKRNYVRVAASDDYQGPAAADLLRTLKKRSVFILHDNETFGKGVANAMRQKAQAARDPGSRLRSVGSEGDELRGASASRSPERTLRPCTSAASSATTASS